MEGAKRRPGFRCCSVAAGQWGQEASGAAPAPAVLTRYRSPLFRKPPNGAPSPCLGPFSAWCVGSETRLLPGRDRAAREHSLSRMKDILYKYCQNLQITRRNSDFSKINFTVKKKQFSKKKSTQLHTVCISIYVYIYKHLYINVYIHTYIQHTQIYINIYTYGDIFCEYISYYDQFKSCFCHSTWYI